MTLALRRRFALGTAATAVAVGAGLLVLPIASAAGDTISLSPSGAFNTDTPKIMISLLAGSNPGYPPQSTVTFTRQGTPDSFSKMVDATSSPAAPTVSPNLASVGSGVGGDGPANPGVYNVTITAPSPPPGPGGLAAPPYSDSCSACFTVLTPNATTTVTGVSPSGLAQGGDGNVTVTGSGFARGSVAKVLLPDGSGPDSSITTNDAPLDTSSPPKPIMNGITTNTTIERHWTVSATTATGPRDVQVMNVDGTSAVCSKCFTVNGGPLTGVSPTAGSNNPQGALTRVTFTGTGLTGGQPSLVFVGSDAGSATKSGLTLTGTNPAYNGTSASADFDLRSAAPGDSVYQPTLTQSDGSQNTCACRFSVLQATPPTVMAMSPASQAAGTSQTVHVTGSDFSRGVRITVSGSDVTTTAVSFIDPSHVDATIQTGGAAVSGARDVTATTTDGKSGPVCTGCYAIGGTSSSSPSASATPTSTISSSPPSSSAGSSAPACPTTSPSDSSSPSASASSSSSSLPILGGGSSSASSSPSASASGSASPTPSGSTSASASPSSSGSSSSAPLPIIGGGSSSASPSASGSSSASGTPSGTASTSASGTPASAGCLPLELSVRPSDITPTVPSTVSIHGSPGQLVDLYAYSRPNTTYGVVRSGTTDANGNVSFSVKPGTNTRLYAHYRSGSGRSADTDSPSAVINVHTALSLSAYRDGFRQYHFQGTNLPRLAGQLITLYRVDGSGHEIRTATVKTGSSGTWRINRTFTGSGTFTFVVRTSQTLNNAAGRSNTRTVTIG